MKRDLVLYSIAARIDDNGCLLLVPRSLLQGRRGRPNGQYCFSRIAHVVHPTALQHKETKHTYPCGSCSRVLYSQQALDQHVEDSHYAFECRFCDRGFTTDNGRLAHEAAKHPPLFECEYCDRDFTTDEGRLSHQRAKHTFECHYCDREFNSEDARQQHEDAKHVFECRHCDREFNSEDARQQHEDAKHVFKCRHCDREFNSEQGREAHEEAKHPTFECHFCVREFDSEDACQQHENTIHRKKITCSHCDHPFPSEEARLQHEKAKHFFECWHCGKSFTRVEALEQHKQTTPHIQCSYCSSKFFTQDAKNGHERSCGCNPANHIQRPTSVSSARPSVRFELPSDKRELTDTTKEGLSTSAVTQCADEESESLASPSRSSDSTSDEGEMFHSTGGISSIGTTGEGAIVEQSCACSICQRTSSPSSHTHRPVPDDAGNLVSVDDHHQDDTMGHHDAIFQCPPCFMLFETSEAFRDHVCASRTTMLRSHCPICYSQFDDGPSLQKHLQGVEFTCQLCLIRCCSQEMLQDHLLSHPTCGKCGESFVDNLALCAVSIFQSHDHLSNEYCHSLILNPFISMWNRTTQSWSVGSAMASLSRKTVSSCITRTLPHIHLVHSVAWARKIRPIWTRFVSLACHWGKHISNVVSTQHVKRMHASSAEIEDRSGGGDVNVSARSKVPWHRANAFSNIRRVLVQSLL